MSKNIVIQEGGVGKQMTADKLKTNLVSGGTCLWVPEDEVTLGSKHITEDGTYEAADDGLYGYSSVTVRGIGKVTGKDPVTGEETQITTEKDPQTGEDVIVSKVIPTRIEITTDPTLLGYVDGDLINFDGMVVKAKTKTGAVFTDEQYPDGVIPRAEWITPSMVAHYDSEAPHGFIAREDSLVYGAGILSENDGRDSIWGVPARTPVYKTNNGWCACFLATNCADSGGNWIGTFCVGLTQEDVEITVSAKAIKKMTVDGKDYYCSWSISNDFWGGATKFTSNPHGLPVVNEQVINVNQTPTEQQFRRWLQILDFQITGEGDRTIQKVPVQWLSPYTGETFESQFAILVSPAPEPEPESGVDAVTGAD